MIDFDQAGRLLKENWKSPRKLAEELYSIATSRQPATVRRPVTIEVPRGQTALRLVADRAELGPSRPRPSLFRRLVRPAPLRDDSTGPPRPAGADAPRGPGPGPGTDRAGTRPLWSPTEPAAYQGGDYAGRSPAESPGRARTDRGAFDVTRFTRPYQSPVLEVRGPATFAGPEPVQFDLAPLFWNPAKGEYLPIQIAPELTNIPREIDKQTSTLIGKVLDEGTGTNADTIPDPEEDPIKYWKVELYPDGPQTTAENRTTVQVEILNLHKDEKAPKGRWITNINQFEGKDKTEYYYLPPTWLD